MRERAPQRIAEPITPESQKAYIAGRDERENSALIGAYHALAEKAIESYRQIFDRNPRRVLEIGCGSGHTAAGLAERLCGAEVTAVDADPAVIRVCEKRYGKSAGGSVDFQVTDVTDLRNYRGSADLVVSISSMHEFPNIQQGLNEIYSSVAEQGIYFFTDLNRDDFARVAGGFFNPELPDPAEYFLDIRRRLSVSQYSSLLNDPEALERIFCQGSHQNNLHAMLVLSSYAAAYTGTELEQVMERSGFGYVIWQNENGLQGAAIKLDVAKPGILFLRGVQRVRRAFKSVKTLNGLKHLL
ncbi:class I SAM-dependent methyltransferase [Candidatus Woesearchaeota archaeon]|nr:class I SAM-dependent methyltransferase [Candidatus Woesearchaeota archaeon]